MARYRSTTKDLENEVYDMAKWLLNHGDEDLYKSPYDDEADLVADELVFRITNGLMKLDREFAEAVLDSMKKMM